MGGVNRKIQDPYFFKPRRLPISCTCCQDLVIYLQELASNDCEISTTNFSEIVCLISHSFLFLQERGGRV